MQKRISAAELNKVVPLAKGTEFKRHASRPVARIHILGAMRATSYLGQDILPTGRKARAILGCLCLASGQRIARSRLAALLWDRVPEFQARASFRQAYRELVVALGSLAKELISADRESIVLDTSACWIDALAVLSLDVLDSPSRSELAAHCSGELLEELDGVTVAFDHWLLSERTRFVERRRALLEAELDEAHGEHTDARARAEIARRLIMFDQTHEGASRILMRALADMGERPQALREFARCRDALKLTLDVEPSPETCALYEAIRSFSVREDKDQPAAPLAPARKPAKSAAPAPSRNRLRVGVLPFLAARSPRDEGVALSLSQEIAAALARFRWFDVIAPIALKRRDGASSLNDDVLRPNELDFVLDGALTSTAEKYQISVRLLDLTQYATPVWSDRFELRVDELHRLDEVVVAPIVGRIDPVILFIEGQPKRREKYGATGLLLRAIPLFYSMDKTSFEEAGRLINEALELDPDNSMVLGWAAHWHMTHVGQAWTNDAARTLAIAEELCLKALRLDPENAEAMGIYAHTCSWKKDFPTALHYFDRALRLNPNLPVVWALSAVAHCYIGDYEGALKRMDRYRELAPFDPYFGFYETIDAIAHLMGRNYATAVTIGRRVAKANPGFVNGSKPLIAALGHLGRADEAKPYIEKLLAIEPNFTVRSHGEVYPFANDYDRAHYMEGLRLAGVPEG
jgi:DNA-binding SARP family transcriptional activator/cytochrome c-type biogenesis protein CcmH/NrfG